MKFTYLLILFFYINSLFVQAQTDTLRLSQSEAILLARKQSLNAFKIKNMFVSKYWTFRSYQASRRPILWLKTTPLNFKNQISKQYDFSNNTDKFVKTNNINSNVRLSIDQKIPWTGGSIYIESKAERYQNLLYKEIPASFSSSPIISLGLTQSVSLFNPLKWQSKLKPKEFERAKQQYLNDLENLSMDAVKNFFKLASAQIDMAIAETNLENTLTLFELGKKRFETNMISEEELLDLELNNLNAEITHANQKLNLQQAQQSLNSFLSLPENTFIICEISKEMPITKIDFKTAYEQAIANNPTLMWYEERLIAADRDVAKRRSEAGLSGTLSAKYGLTGNNTDFAKAYKDPGDYQQLSVSLNFPLVDWGERKGQYLMAKSNREVVQAEVQQGEIDFEQDLYRRVVQFNLQKQRVLNSIRADQIALKAYQITSQRFESGEINVLKLNSARSAKDKAKRAYLNTLREYWVYYYEIRKRCLYDFIREVSFSEDFSRLINEL